MRTALAIVLFLTGSVLAQNTIGFSRTAKRYDRSQLGKISVLPTSLATNCVLWLTFSVNDGNTYYDFAGTRDAAGVASPSWTNENGGGVVLNGSSQYLTNGAWAVPVAQYTWAIWFKPSTALSTTNGNTYRAFMGSYYDSGTRDQIYYFRTPGQLNYSAPGAFISLSVTTNIPAQTWLHVAVSRSASNFTMYINGIQRASAVTNLVQAAVNRKTYIGQDGAGSYADMTAGEAQIFNRGLTSNEVVNLYNATKGDYGL
jgi:hypothetical protein